MDPDFSLPCSQQPETRPCPKGRNPGRSLILCFCKIHFNPLKPIGKCIYIPPALTISNGAFSNYAFQIILTVNSDSFLQQH